MSIEAIQAARLICKSSGWKVSNLDVQRLLYLAHMVHLGRHGTALVSGHFEATMLGPVHQTLFRQLERFGGRPIRNVFHDVPDLGGSYRAVIEETMRVFWPASRGRLVAATQGRNGAWGRSYAAGYRAADGHWPAGPIIPAYEIEREYALRTGAVRQAA